MGVANMPHLSDADAREHRIAIIIHKPHIFPVRIGNELCNPEPAGIVVQHIHPASLVKPDCLVRRVEHRLQVLVLVGVALHLAVLLP